MSSSTTNPFARLQRLVRSVPTTEGYRVLTAPVRAAAFWAAVFLPVVSLALFVTGVDGDELASLSTLAVANVLALIVGHGHNRTGRR